MLAQTGSLSFIDIADTNGTQFMTNSYGTEFHDFDDDGDLDLFMVGADRQPSKIFRNNGGNQFTDVDTAHRPRRSCVRRRAISMAASPSTTTTTATSTCSFTTTARTASKAMPASCIATMAIGTFTDVTVAEGMARHEPRGLRQRLGRHRPRRRPRPDRGHRQHLLRTRLSQRRLDQRQPLALRELAGPDNTTGIGASVYATLDEGTPDERTLRREANTNAGTFNQSDLPVHFGLGSADHIDKLRIEWPDGTIQLLLDVSVNQYLTVTIPGPGDFDGDGDVDGHDFLVWQRGESSHPLTRPIWPPGKRTTVPAARRPTPPFPNRIPAVWS